MDVSYPLRFWELTRKGAANDSGGAGGDMVQCVCRRCSAADRTSRACDFPAMIAFAGGNDPAVNAIEPIGAKMPYRSHAGYVFRFIAATRAVENDGFILRSAALRLVLEAAFSDIAK